MEKDGTEYLELIAKHLRAETSQEEDALLFRWLEESHTNKDYFEQVKKVWNISKKSGVDEFKPNTEAAWLKVKGQLNLESAAEVNENSKIRPLFEATFYLKIAASILFVLGLSYLLLNRNAGKKEMVELVAFNERKEFYLPDSSKIWLNRNSKLQYEKDFNRQDRVVYLDGEAFFDVRKLSGKSFVIYGNLSKTEVLGTSFNLRAYKKEQREEVEVVTGKVAFSKRLNQEDQVLLTPGLKGRLSQGNAVVKEKIADPNFEAWKNDKLIFDNISIQDVAQVMENYFNQSVKIESQELLNCRFTGTFERPTIEEILKVLSVSTNLSYTKKDNAYHLSGKGCN